MTVLVGVREVLQIFRPETIPDGRWLKDANDVHGRGRDTFQKVPHRVRPTLRRTACDSHSECAHGGIDGKLRPSVSTPGCWITGQIVDRIVEGGAEVVDHLPCLDA